MFLPLFIISPSASLAAKRVSYLGNGIFFNPFDEKVAE